jgi:hypothetical protein
MSAAEARSSGGREKAMIDCVWGSARTSVSNVQTWTRLASCHRGQVEAGLHPGANPAAIFSVACHPVQPSASSPALDRSYSSPTLPLHTSNENGTAACPALLVGPAPPSRHAAPHTGATVAPRRAVGTTATAIATGTTAAMTGAATTGGTTTATATG